MNDPMNKKYLNPIDDEKYYFNYLNEKTFLTQRNCQIKME